jgi:hypothetical protein
MKTHSLIIFVLIIGLLGSCDKPVKEFQIDSDVQHRTLKLFKDSTFIEEVEEIENSYQYSGIWAGSLAEGKTFNTTATQKDYQILTLTPLHVYRIVNGQAVENKDLKTETTHERGTSTVNDYSKEFLEYFEKSKLTLKSDSILLPIEADSAIILIPKYIPKNRNVTFESDKGNSVTIRQINYTDLEFTIEYKGETFNGKASLSPYFHMGMETVGFSDGEYIITHYYVTETDNSCIDFIGLGNQNISEENSENVYALVSVSGGTCEDELNELTNKKLRTVANKR